MTTVAAYDLLDELRSVRDEAAGSIDELDQFNAFFIGSMAAELNSTATGRRAWSKAMSAAKQGLEDTRTEQGRKAAEVEKAHDLADELTAALAATEHAEEVARS